MGFVSRIKAKHVRMDFTLDRQFQIERLKFEYEKLKEMIHLFVWGGISGFAGIAFTLIYQSFYATPPIISRTTLYRMGLISTFVEAVLPVVGYWVGIVLPVLQEMDDVTYTVRKYEVWLKRKTIRNKNTTRKNLRLQ